MKSPIPSEWQVPDVFRARMGHGAGRQRAMSAEGHVLIVLHARPDPGEPTRRAACLFWRSPEGRWRSSTAKAAVDESPLRAHVESFAQAAEKLDDELDVADSADDYFRVLREVAPLLRTSRNMHRALQEAREAIGNDRALIAVRDLANDVERAMELIHDFAKEGLDFTIARKAEEHARSAVYMSEAGHRLNLLAALFLPMTAIASLLGMNLEHGLERWNAPWAFWIVSAVSLLLGFGVRISLPRPPEPIERKKPVPEKSRRT